MRKLAEGMKQTTIGTEDGSEHRGTYIDQMTFETEKSIGEC